MSLQADIRVISNTNTHLPLSWGMFCVGDKKLIELRTFKISCDVIMGAGSTRYYKQKQECYVFMQENTCSLPILPWIN